MIRNLVLLPMTSALMISAAAAEKPCVNEASDYVAAAEAQAMESRNRLFDCLALTPVEPSSPAGAAGVFLNLAPAGGDPTWFPMPPMFEDFLVRQGVALDVGTEVKVLQEDQIPPDQIVTQPEEILLGVDPSSAPDLTDGFDGGFDGGFGGDMGGGGDF